jgi:hypothetical protein
VLDALRTGMFYGSTGPEIRDIEVSEGDVVVRCSPAEAVTLYSGRRSGARANAGRLGYPNHSEIIERNDDGLITAARLFRPYEAPYGRIEVLDRSGNKAWSNSLWTA